jgi:plasmid stabilization system protein ParE
MGKVRWTSEAELWMKEIHDFIARDSPTAAQRTVRGVYERAKLLTRFPQLGYLYRDQPPPPSAFFFTATTASPT